MTLVYMDSFDHYSSVADKGWVGSIYYGLVGARNGNGLYAAGNWQGGNNGYVYREFPGAYGEIIQGQALRSTRLANEGMYWYDVAGGAYHLYTEWDGAGHLVFKRGDGTVLGTTTSVWATNADKYLEVWLKVHDTTGFLKVYVNGNQEINFSGDTRNGGNGTVSRFYLQGFQITFEGDHKIIIDDLYLIDNGDASYSAPLGDVKVECKFPNGNGNSSQFVGSDGNSTDNYLLVDEAAPNGDTDYVESSTVGNKDTYLVTDLTTLAGSVKGVQVNTYAKKDDAGARTYCQVARLSGTEEDGATITPTTTYAYAIQLRLTKPGGGTWSIADVNSTEFGYKVVS